jgi:predicted translin family RNA/ssDNA-binding protein
MHRKLEKMKMELMEKHEVEFGELYFSLIPTTSVQEFLTDKNLKTFLKKQKTPFIEEDITAILR